MRDLAPVIDAAWCMPKAAWHRPRRPAGADAARAARRIWRRYRGGQRAALRHPIGNGGCTRPTRHARRGSSARCRAGRRERRCARRPGLPHALQTASSTSAARRPPATSARRRCCRRWWRACCHLPRPRRFERRIAHPRGELSAVLAAGLKQLSRRGDAAAFDTVCVATGAKDQKRYAPRGCRHQPAPRSAPVGITLDETTTREDIDTLCAVRARPGAPGDAVRSGRVPLIPHGVAGAAAAYLRTRSSAATTARPRCCATCSLADKDHRRSIRSMIPLGSCTMKLRTRPAR